MKKSTGQITERAVRDILQRPEGMAILQEAGRAFVGVMFGEWPVLRHVTRKGRTERITEVTGGIPQHLFSKVRQGYRVERTMEALREAYIALGASASTYFMYGGSLALHPEDYSTACELLRNTGIPEDEVDVTIDEIMRAILARMGTLPGRCCWALLCALGHNAFREHGVIFEAAA